MVQGASAISLLSSSCGIFKMWPALLHDLVCCASVCGVTQRQSLAAADAQRARLTVARYARWWRRSWDGGWYRLAALRWAPPPTSRLPQQHRTHWRCGGCGGWSLTAAVEGTACCVMEKRWARHADETRTSLDSGQRIHHSFLQARAAKLARWEKGDRPASVGNGPTSDTAAAPPCARAAGNVGRSYALKLMGLAAWPASS